LRIASFAILAAAAVVFGGCRRGDSIRGGEGPIARGPSNVEAFRSVELRILGRPDAETELSEAESIEIKRDGRVTHVLYGPGKLDSVPGERREVARAETRLDLVRLDAFERKLADVRAHGIGERYDLSERIAIGTRPFAEAWLVIDAAERGRKRVHFTSAMSSTAPLELVDFVEMLANAVEASGR
jgi:hypothetical protein